MRHSSTPGANSKPNAAVPPLILLSKTRRIDAYSSTHRLFTEQQRLAMMARDLGCSFPTCDTTPLWTEAHHVTEYHDGGPTSTDNGALVCGQHHGQFEQMGWRSVIIDGVPWWVPPDWIDPQHRPVQNPLQRLEAS